MCVDVICIFVRSFVCCSVYSAAGMLLRVRRVCSCGVKNWGKNGGKVEQEQVEGSGGGGPQQKGLSKYSTLTSCVQMVTAMYSFSS